jgi:hypothetical protein
VAEDATDHLRVFDERDRLEPIPAARAREDVEAKLRCISSAHSQFVRGRMAASGTDDESAPVGSGLRWLISPASGGIHWHAKYTAVEG